MDVDIDFADRSIVLQDLFHIPASIIKNKEIKKHNTGVYFQDVPTDPLMEIASVDNDVAFMYGYFKLDFLNLHIYSKVKDEEHLSQLMNQEPLWEMLQEKSIVDELFHLNGNFDIVDKMKPKSIIQLAMVLAAKIPCKRHLIGKPWQEVEKDIWLPPDDGSFSFKKSHCLAYATVIVVQMNILLEQLENNDV